VATHSPLQIFLIDPSVGRILAQTPIENAGRAEITRMGDGLVLLAERGLGRPKLLVAADAGGVVRAVDIDLGDATDLVVDPGGRTAYAVSVTSVAEVALDTLAVAYHPVRAQSVALGRRPAAIAPEVKAKEVTFVIRQAFWVGGGRIAFTGFDATFDGRRVSSTPVGLGLIDTSTWTARTVDSQVGSAVLVGGVLLTGDHEGGLVAYDLRGVRRYRLFAGRQAAVTGSFAGRAYVNVGRRRVPVVIDARTGRVLSGQAVQLPFILVERADWRTP
jgi:hypothetical protein